MTRKRRSFSATEKAAAVRKHLVDKIPVSQIAEQMQVQPTLIHGWINVVMAQAERAFEAPRQAKTQRSDHEEKLATLPPTKWRIPNARNDATTVESASTK